MEEQRTEITELNQIILSKIDLIKDLKSQLALRIADIGRLDECVNAFKETKRQHLREISMRETDIIELQQHLRQREDEIKAQKTDTTKLQQRLSARDDENNAQKERLARLDGQIQQFMQLTQAIQNASSERKEIYNKNARTARAMFLQSQENITAAVAVVKQTVNRDDRTAVPETEETVHNGNDPVKPNDIANASKLTPPSQPKDVA